MELPLDWQGELLAEQHSHRTWHISYPSQPQLEALPCQVTELVSVGFFCEYQGAMWLLQEQNGENWLTRFSRRDKALAQPDWRGEPVQELTSEGQMLRVYLSNQHPKQLYQFVQFRYQGRAPRLMELSHGRFYLSLQLPAEELFLYQQGTRTLVVSALTVGTSKR